MCVINAIEMCAECRLTKYDVRNELLKRCWCDLTSYVNWFKYNSSFWNMITNVGKSSCEEHIAMD